MGWIGPTDWAYMPDQACRASPAQILHVAGIPAKLSLGTVCSAHLGLNLAGTYPAQVLDQPHTLRATICPSSAHSMKHTGSIPHVLQYAAYESIPRPRASTASWWFGLHQPHLTHQP